MPSKLPAYFQVVHTMARLSTPAIVCGAAAGSYSYSDVNTRSNRLANYLVKTGLEAGQVVACLLERSFASVIAFWAVQKAGGGSPKRNCSVYSSLTWPSARTCKLGVRRCLCEPGPKQPREGGRSSQADPPKTCDHILGEWAPGRSLWQGQNRRGGGGHRTAKRQSAGGRDQTATTSYSCLHFW